MDKKQTISAACLLLSIAKADDKIEENEIELTREIIKDFFNLDNILSNTIIDKAKNELNEATDLFEFGKELNKSFSYQDKIDFIFCTYEIGLADKILDKNEEYLIKKIANILNVHNEDLIAVKSDIKKYL